jgi:hypothetical protein
MGLLDRFFGTAKDAEAGAGTAPSTQFRESEPDSDDSRASRNTPRRELVQVILRDTMRKHGIPSDWVDVRVLSSVSRSGRKGLHVNFVVHQAHDRLLAYVFAFQDSFERELARFDPRAADWLLSLGWEFQGFSAAEMPVPKTWSQSAPSPLQVPTPSNFGSLNDEAAEPPKSEDDVQRDLAALFAIRDAAMAEAIRKPAPDHPDFQPTQPFEDTDDGKS